MDYYTEETKLNPTTTNSNLQMTVRRTNNVLYIGMFCLYYSTKVHNTKISNRRNEKSNLPCAAHPSAYMNDARCASYHIHSSYPYMLEICACVCLSQQINPLWL